MLTEARHYFCISSAFKKAFSGTVEWEIYRRILAICKKKVDILIIKVYYVPILDIGWR